jgi:hypothetical protein
MIHWSSLEWVYLPGEKSHITKLFREFGARVQSANFLGAPESRKITGLMCFSRFGSHRRVKHKFVFANRTQFKKHITRNSHVGGR